ncbi:hypothetical protein TNIN_217261 [Trichonephila inaurata madagascariensis]|uniref:Uncharacterized protein n=1 Tax=Trichonephila inaurata madagascariensis TaxID=2747483 RepID=A0A8X6XDT0_9ARAC|nr:hypothetical protein TNIN_217261 [Trichonephila inaurata madagascariensis]
MEVQAINFLLPKHMINVVNAYHLNTSPIDTDLLHELASLKAEMKILLGDLDVKSPSCGNRSLDSKGIQVEDLVDDLNLTNLSTEEKIPTFAEQMGQRLPLILLPLATY